MGTNYTSEEKDSLIKLFEAMEVKPKMDTVESLQNWMQDYVRGQQRASGVEPQDTKPKVDNVIHKTVVQSQARIVPFSGSGGPNEVSFEAWKYEVCGLLKDGTHAKSDVEAAAKKSLRGEAANVVRRLGVFADITTVIDKLDGMYGVVEDSESLLSQFYNAKQLPDEKVTSWGCRLEDLLDRANKQEPLQARSLKDMLRTKFWNGLLSHLKEASRHMKDHIRDYDALFIEVRKIECETEMMPDKSYTASTNSSRKDVKRPHIKATNAVEDDSQPQESDMSMLKGLICKMSTRLDSMEKTMKATSEVADTSQKSNNTSGPHGQPHDQMSQGYRGRGQDRYQNRRRPNYNGNFRGNSQRLPYGNSGFNNQWNNPGPVPQHAPRVSDVQCYRCAQYGHVAIGCRAILDTPSPSLNQQESV